ncbi:MAG: asparagine synthase (glutamine-hydrolyzing) [Deltaproteobacteria bacterium]|nr:asparagine synthase (glutamine-hydrolyzing) [Deltaproteobacteria bacterium]
MCGIVGFKSNRDFGRLRDSLPEATSRLVHRGPDDTGLFFDQESGVGLGHRRLSVIDLSEAGRQPMASDDGMVHIAYNGEIYNFQKIRITLEGHGHHFRTRTDTEVILKAYMEWGIGCLTRFVGMFALALWDKRIGKLFLARDRIGIKPLYYYYAFLFASELKALMAFKGFPKDIDPDAVPLFLHYQYIPSPRTVFKDTFKLLPGRYAVFDGRDMEVRSYWDLPPVDGNPQGEIRSEEEVVADLDQLLTRAVSDRLVSDVPLGALLSGGIDSSIVVALMQKVSASPVRTFSIGFNEPAYNEAPWALKVAEHLGTDHTEFYVTPAEALQIIPRLPDIYDEPFADSSAIPTLLVSRLARSRVTVALSGDGGDEQFCGYVRYWGTGAMADAPGRVPEAARHGLSLVLGRIPPSWVERCYLPWRRFLPQRFRLANFRDKWEKFIRLLDHNRIQDLYRMTICLWSEKELQGLMGKGLARTRYEDLFRETEGWPVLSRLMRVDQKTYLPDAMLTKVDRASMAVGLEVRVPLLDHRVVEFTSGIPDSLKYRGGEGKYLLKRLLARYLPQGLFQRPKMGFGVPIDRWLRLELKEMLTDYLSPERLRKEGLFDGNLIETKIREHLTGRANHQYRLWSLLMWEMWRKRWIP